MTQEEKQLLIKDLCVRLPYEIKSSVTEFDDDDGSEYYSDCKILGIRKNQLVEFRRTKDNKEVGRSDWHDVSLFKPYLRPLSSMTEEEKKEFRRFITWQFDCNYQANTLIEVLNGNEFETDLIVELFNWLNAHHFDYRGLILMGLALEAPHDMYNIK